MTCLELWILAKETGGNMLKQLRNEEKKQKMCREIFGQLPKFLENSRKNS